MPFLPPNQQCQSTEGKALSLLDRKDFQPIKILAAVIIDGPVLSQVETEQPVRTGEYHGVDDVFHDDENGSDTERTRLLPPTTASEAKPSSSPPPMSQPTTSMVAMFHNMYFTV